MFRASLADRRQRGFTLTEMAVVLGVIGTIIGSIWVAEGSVSNARKTERAAEQIQTTLNNYRQLYSTRGIDGAVADVTCLGSSVGYFPADMANSTACVADGSSTGHPLIPWRGGYALAETMPSKNIITIQYGPISRAACISLASRIYNSSDMVYQYIWNTSNVASFQYLSPFTTNAPWTLTKITALCSAASGNYVVIGVSAR